ncbi:MAG: hypothetical protein COB30_012830 [Ectothiorhodospiraceae bacterium]|nr:hypothetical protein [Ectothiorhodospiraceae bacterium]
MNNHSELYIAGMGMITPVGANVEMTSAFVSSGLSGYQVSEYKNWQCKPITMARVPDDAFPEICDELDTSEEMSDQIARMVLMAHLAIEEVMNAYPGTAPLPLILSGPEIDTDLEVPFSSSFFELLAAQSNIAFDRENSRLLGIGRAGVINGIDMAFKYLDQGHDYVLVGGVDSHEDYDLLLKLAAQGRITAEGSSDGFVPGEAASFLLLTAKKELASIINGSVLSLSIPGLSHEPGHLKSEATYTGDGLAESFKIALTNADEPLISCVYSSMNGENYWAKEYGVAMIRNSIAEDVIHEHPADCYGDIGAATGAVLISISALSLAAQKCEKSHLIYTSSDTAYRASIFLKSSLV